MTANQISYATLLENKRHNVAGETETNRTNIANEQIKRSDIAQRAYDNAQSRQVQREDIAQRASDNAASRALEQQRIDNAVRQTDITSWDSGYDYMGPNGSVLGESLGVLGSTSSKVEPFTKILKTAYTMFN